MCVYVLKVVLKHRFACPAGMKGRIASVYVFTRAAAVLGLGVYQLDPEAKALVVIPTPHLGPTGSTEDITRLSLWHI